MIVDTYAVLNRIIMWMVRKPIKGRNLFTKSALKYNFIKGI